MVRALIIRVGLLVVAVASYTVVPAQILLKPSGGSMEPLHQKSLEAEAKVTGQFAATKMTHIFANPTYARVEAEFIYTIPVGATVTSFAYWYGKEKVIAYVAEKERARQIYKSITERQRDPALVELVGKRTFRAKIFPVMPKEDLKVEVTWVAALTAINGVPTYVLPIAMKAKEDQLESLKAHVEIQREPWMRVAMNNKGLLMSDDLSTITLDWNATKIRPTEDLKIGLKPVADKPVASLFTGRSGGADGFFAFNAISANKPDFKVSGVKIFSVHQQRMGANVVVTGKYRGSGSGIVSLGNRTAPISFSNEAFPGHLGVKLWATDEISRLTANHASAKQITFLSIQHSMPSKYTAWIAIPAEERKLHEQLIKQAKARVLATSLVKTAIRQGGRYAASPAAMNQYRIIATEAGFDADQLLREETQTALWSQIEEIGESIQTNSISAKTRASVGRKVANLKSIGNSMGVNMSEMIATSLGGKIYQSANRVAEQQFTGKPNDAQLTKDHKIIADYCSILGLAEKEVIAPHYYQAVSNQVNQLLDNVYHGWISEADLEKSKNKILAFAAEHKINPRGFYGRSNYEVASILAQEELNEPVDKNQVVAAHRWLDAALSLKILNRENFIRDSKTNWLTNDCYNAGMKYYYESDKTSATSPGAIQFLDRIARNIERSDPKSRSLFEQPIRSLVYRAGETLAQKALRANDPVAADNEFKKVHDLFAEKFGNYKLAGLKDLEMVYEGCIRSGVSAMAWDLFNYKNSVTQTKKGIRERQANIERMAKWAKVEPKDLNKDWPAYLSEEGKVRYELLHLQIARSTDTARIAKLEKKLKDFTPAKNTTYKDDRVARISAHAKANTVLDDIDETNDPEAKAQLQKQYGEYMAKAKVITARMGDPLLMANLPSTDKDVTATFPWGEVRPMIWNAKAGRFECRFDIPPTATEGLHDVTIKATDANGKSIEEKSSIHVDITAPRFDVDVKDGRVEVKDRSGDIARIRAFVNNGEPIDLVRGANSTWWVNTTVQPSDRIRVIATDKAHNRSEFPVLSPAKPTVVEKLILGAAKQELAGHNIQSLGVLRDLVFAGTLEEGLWVRRADDTWSEIKGLPTQCPRNMVEFGGSLIVRYGDGNLIQIAPDLSWKQLNSNLPRKQAMGLATDGKSLFVAQPGGYSQFDDKTWSHHFGIAELEGKSVSAFAATESKLWIGLQGMGLLRIDRATGKTDAFDERAGLTDDWITQIQPTNDGVIVGTFIGGALGLKDGAFVPLNGTSEKCVTSMTSGLTGTRTGLFQLESGTLRQIEAPGLGEEIQAVVQIGNTLRIGTRNGVLAIRK